MARQTDVGELAAAWRALIDSSRNTEGWSTIQVASDLHLRVRAGRHFPGNEEALLVGFRASHLPVGIKLPEGRGFGVSLVHLGEITDGLAWISLSRRGLGTIEMFSAMSADILNSIAALSNADEAAVVQKFLARIAAWQYFMERGKSPVLDQEAEIGLVGEVLLLNRLLDCGITPKVATDSWRGPLGAVRDFELGRNSIEVKATISPSDFPAAISSFGQLDDDIGRNVFLAAIRLTVQPSGATLPELITSTEDRLQSDHSATDRFQQLILRAGFLSEHAGRYNMRTFLAALELMHVTDEFPRLIKSKLPAPILTGSYVLDLNQVRASRSRLEDILQATETDNGTG
jgi:hypothetical protein